MAEADYIIEDREQEEAEEMASFVNENGVAAIPEELQRRLHAWKSIDLNIGIIGATGVGKSTFINTMRRVKPSDPLAAATGVVQMTMQPTQYEHPLNPSVKLWDLPGVGTTEFPRKSYLQQIQFNTYDFFVIICCTRFTEDDVWFAEEVRKGKKRFYFVRTKTDIDIGNEREDHPERYHEDAVLKLIRDDCIAHLREVKFTDPDVFLVCKNPSLYDFPSLDEQLINDLPVLKREVALFTLQSASKLVIKEKTKQLKKRSWLVALASGVVGAVPVPGLSLAVDTAILLGEHAFYKQVYGLDSKGLQQLSESACVPEEVLGNAIKSNYWVNLTTGAMLKAMGSLGIGMIAEEGLKLIPIPIVASLLGGALSFGTTKFFLCSSIESMEKAALTVLDVAFSEAKLRAA